MLMLNRVRGHAASKSGLLLKAVEVRQLQDEITELRELSSKAEKMKRVLVRVSNPMLCTRRTAAFPDNGKVLLCVDLLDKSEWCASCIARIAGVY
ncbi:MAG: hypothetical protein AABY46_04430 [Nitrospirota bacterium]